MTYRFSTPALPLIVLTDLDGTLLDHHSYSFAAAEPALNRLRRAGVPLVIVTSKTRAEVARLADRLESPHPYVLENGALIALPPGYFGEDGGALIRLSPAYEELCAWAARIRREKGYRFRGFADMDAAAVAAATGLSEEDAALAKARDGSEPFIWEDTPEALQAFSADVEARGWRLMQGGRFYHLLGRTDKAYAAEQLLSHYRELPGEPLRSIALGDSPNDLPLLQIADIAVVIRRHDGSWMDAQVNGRKIQTEGIGPVGWNEAVGSILTELESTHV
ncbi:HAD-IIB family hydrolase [Granulosicoccaceae sp. 1_MG-2023]|nr:HAD-IIB family hydrolase [Granulosicoccaceae sp. 1_MG-2023]